MNISNCLISDKTAILHQKLNMNKIVNIYLKFLYVNSETNHWSVNFVFGRTVKSYKHVNVKDKYEKQNCKILIK